MKKFFEMSFKEQIIITIVLSVLVFGLFYFILIRPRVAQFNEISEQEQLEIKKFSEITMSFNRLKEIKKETETIEKKLEELKSKLPESEDIPSIITDVQSIATESNVDFISIKPLTYIGKGEYTEVPFELTIKGRFFDLLDFLYRIEKSKRKYAVSKITINPTEEGLPSIYAVINSSAFMLIKTQTPQK